jgi:hypothetical protein
MRGEPPVASVRVSPRPWWRSAQTQRSARWWADAIKLAALRVPSTMDAVKSASAPTTAYLPAFSIDIIPHRVACERVGLPRIWIRTQRARPATGRRKIQRRLSLHRLNGIHAYVFGRRPRPALGVLVRLPSRLCVPTRGTGKAGSRSRRGGAWSLYRTRQVRWWSYSAIRISNTKCGSRIE